MAAERWTMVDEWLAARVVGDDPALDAAAAANAAAGLPPIDVSPLHGRMLELLARLQGASSILELGTLGGYSTICLARALPPDGRLVSLEANPAYAEVARANVARAGLASLVEVRVGPALETLPGVAADGLGPFDLVFIDADKESTPEYFRRALELTRPGSLIVTDNVVRGGSVAAPDGDERAAAMRRFVELLAAEPRVSATVIQTVGSKGYDGFALALVTGS
jgi:predicted O-methyltransferase YrrM